MFMSAQLIIKGNIFLKTTTVASEPDQTSWKLPFELTALRHSKSEGIRLLGHAEIIQEDILRLGMGTVTVQYGLRYTRTVPYTPRKDSCTVRECAEGNLSLEKNTAGSEMAESIGLNPPTHRMSRYRPPVYGFTGRTGPSRMPSKMRPVRAVFVRPVTVYGTVPIPISDLRK
ncbi:hypothetical protein GGX14DRAFT_403726 [Mycena pura]|uniref:Uncharacterized protein n=1 Tax=Mycena pura TaxID=153505 RepID=A0AAD6Y607_9AGAR|nr:hypothetical protein GGX14DRAFT_403726 [Mycena pura]